MPYADPEKRRAFAREYYRGYNAARRKSEPEKYREINRRSNRKHRQEFPLASYMYNLLRRLINPDRRSEHRRHYLRHPEQYARREAKRRSRIEEQVPIDHDSTSVKKIYKRASELRQWFDVVVDHIIPLSRGGLHEVSNLQIIYAKENAVKGVRLDYTPSVIFT